MVRIIKLDGNAIVRFLGQYCKENYEEIMQDENPEHKALDFVLTKNNEFLFVSQDYDDQIDLTSEHRNKIIKKIPATTDSMFNNKKKFVKLSKKEFLKLIEEDK